MPSMARVRSRSSVGSSSRTSPAGRSSPAETLVAYGPPVGSASNKKTNATAVSSAVGYSNLDKFDEDFRKKTTSHVEAERHPWWSAERLVYYDFSELPPYLQDNEWIYGKYRAHYSYVEAWISLFHVHNETCNMWTHFAPFFVCIARLIAHIAFNDLHPNASAMDYLMMSIFLGCAAYTFITSTLFHMKMCVSRHAFKIFGCLDYSGISASICGGAVSIVYYLLWCDPIARILWILVLFVVNFVGIVGPMFKFWSGPAFRVGRAVVYLSSGVLSCGPAIYKLLLFGTQGLPTVNDGYAVVGILFALSLYVIGSIFYMGRIPERFWPGAFDVFGHSHTIWHVIVVTAIFNHYLALRSWMDWRLDTNHQCPT